MPMRAVVVAGTLLGIGWTLAGCGGTKTNGPKTFPVKGKVTFTKGGEVRTLYDRQAMIIFDSVEQPGTRAIGEIQEDGSFTVATLKEGAGTPGAIEGTHRVRIELDDSATRFVAPQFLDFQKSGITVKVPSDQALEVNIWK